MIARRTVALVILAIFSACSFVALEPPGLHAATPAATTQSTPAADLHKKFTDLFMEGQWDDLERDLAAAKEIPGLSPAQKSDLTYIRKSLADARQPWRKQAKLGKTFNFKPVVWGRPLIASFDPTAKASVQMNFTNAQAFATLMWPSADMDSTAPAEHGFTKGELCDLGLWSSLSMADAWSNIPLQTMAALNEPGRTQMQRYLDFRSCVGGLFHALPRARLLGLGQHSASFMNGQATNPTINARRAIGAMLIVEVLTHPDKYPTLQPSAEKDDWNEEAVALHFKDLIEKSRAQWSFAEDKSIREAILKFATPNEALVLKTGKVTLPNNLPVALDPEQDKPLQEKRTAWIKTQMEKNSKKP